MEQAVEVTDLVKRYGRLTALDGISFTVSPGEVVALLGRNGAGKTTAVECIEGFRTPDAGQVRVLGHDPTQRAAVTPHLGVMLQEGGAYQAATPREMLRLYAWFYRDSQEPEALLSALSLKHRANARVRTLSGGEKQRLNLALALVGRPKVAILDEPTAGLDPAVRRTVWQLVRELRDEGTAVLLTTHFMDEAEELADRIGIIDRGRLLVIGAAAAITDASASERLVVETPSSFDPAALASAVGAAVTPAGTSRWYIDADAASIPAVARWFTDRGLSLEGITVDRGTLEEVFLRLTAADADGAP